MSKRTLENPLLYRNFLKALERNNPDIDIDPEIIDRTLEPDEAFNEIRQLYPNLKMTGKEKSELQQFRDSLNEEFGIDERRIQNLIIADPKQPFTEQELAGVSYAIHGRSDHAVAVDKGKKAKTTRDVRRWSDRPNRLDIQGIDTPGLSKHDRARIDILAKLNTCSGQKRGCGDPAKRLELLKSTGRYDKRDLEAAFDAAKEAGYFDSS
jgi:hypothetical protein